SQYLTTAGGAAVALNTRSAAVAHFLAGAVLCALSVKVVKRLIRQPRPVNRLMPSTHSAAIWFFASYAVLANAQLPTHPAFPQAPAFRTLSTYGLVLWASVVAGSRLWLGHHTVAQVAVGSAYGMGCAYGWFVMWTRTGLAEFGHNLEREYLQRL
ncbi:hypothetical protein AURDEDRAFT_55881, partial [Auricularia subglabra TFB-10046 SS5]